MVIQFPRKKEIKLKDEHVKRLNEFAQQYVILMDDIVNDFGIASSTNEEMQEVFDLVLETLLDSFDAALFNQSFETD